MLAYRTCGHWTLVLYKALHVRLQYLNAKLCKDLDSQ